jgi:hypothetical protein
LAINPAYVICLSPCPTTPKKIQKDSSFFSSVLWNFVFIRNIWIGHFCFDGYLVNPFNLETHVFQFWEILFVSCMLSCPWWSLSRISFIWILGHLDWFNFLTLSCYRLNVCIFSKLYVETQFLMW